MSLQLVERASQLPSQESLPQAVSSDATTAAFLSSAYGLAPDPWQLHVLEAWLGRQDDGRWSSMRCGLAIPRQNGKNGIIEIRVLYGMVALGEKWLHTAHEVKALDVATPILAERGWTTMGDLDDSDRVYAPDGSLTAINAHPWRHDRPCYRLTLADGQTVVADEDHLWEAFDCRFGKRRVVNTRTMAEQWVSERQMGGLKPRMRREYRWRLDLPEPIAGLGAPVGEIPPWLLGFWLGDGDKNGGRLTCGEQDLAFLIRRLVALGERVLSVRADPRTGAYSVQVEKLRTRLRHAGLLGYKTVPDEVFEWSVADRLELLRGLMDSDGTVAGHQIANTQKRQQLAEGMASLARSLGFKASLTVVQASCSGRPAGPVWRMVMGHCQALNPFSMPRKAALVFPQHGKQTRAHYNAIVNIEPVEARPTRCITVEHPSALFLVGRGFIPTHNTARKAFLRLKSFFENPRLWPELAAVVDEIRNTNGQEAVFLTNGGSCEFIARSKSSGRGFTVDGVICDEAQELGDAAQEALLPATSAAPQRNPQWIFTGTPPGPTVDGSVFTKLRRDGINGGKRRFAWQEWSVESLTAAQDLEAIYRVNPGLVTGRLQLEVVEAERDQFSDEGFARERGGYWSNRTATSVITDLEWLAVHDPESRRASEDLVFAVDAELDRSAASISVATVNQAGRVHVELTDPVDPSSPKHDEPFTVPEAGERLLDLARRHRPKAVVILSTSPAASLIPILKAHDVPVMVLGAQQARAACGALIDAITKAKSVAHTGLQTELNDSVVLGRKHTTAAGWTWAEDPGTASLRSVTWAHFGWTAQPPAPSTPIRRVR